MQEPVANYRKDVNVIGYAGMASDGKIVMRLHNKADNESKQRGVVIFSPGDDQYAQMFAHLGGISPGQKEPVSPFYM